MIIDEKKKEQIREIYFNTYVLPTNRTSLDILGNYSHFVGKQISEGYFTFPTSIHRHFYLFIDFNLLRICGGLWTLLKVLMTLNQPWNMNSWMKLMDESFDQLCDELRCGHKTHYKVPTLMFWNFGDWEDISWQCSVSYFIAPTFGRTASR